MLVLASLAAIALIAVRPAVIIGISDEPLAESLADETGGEPTGRCVKSGDDFRCTAPISQRGSSGATAAFDVSEDGFGCWVAKPRGGSGRPEKGCLTIFDYVLN